MPAMTNPHDALLSFQKALTNGAIRPNRCELDSNLYVHLDMPAPDVQRFSYVRLDAGVVRAFATFVLTEPIDGLPTFQVGYAVPERFRGRGRAADVLKASIAELQHGLARNRVRRIAIEAVVGADNPASIRVAEQVLQTNPTEITDEFSGQPALQYVGLFGEASI